MHLTDEVLAPIRARYGEPVVLPWEGEISDPELALIARTTPVAATTSPSSSSNGDRLALIRKHAFRARDLADARRRDQAG